MVMEIKPLTEKERKEAELFFLTNLRGKSTDEITESRRKDSTKFFNWCRIASTTQYYEEWKKLLQPEREKSYLSYERIKKSEMKKKVDEFIREHLIGKEDIDKVIYQIISETELANGDCVLVLAIPFDNMRYGVAKFGAGIEIYRRKNPLFFEWIKQKFKHFEGDVEIVSNNAFYNTRVR